MAINLYHRALICIRYLSEKFRAKGGTDEEIKGSLDMAEQYLNKVRLTGREKDALNRAIKKAKDDLQT